MFKKAAYEADFIEFFRLLLQGHDISTGNAPGEMSQINYIAIPDVAPRGGWLFSEKAEQTIWAKHKEFSEVCAKSSVFEALLYPLTRAQGAFSFDLLEHSDFLHRVNLLILTCHLLRFSGNDALIANAKAALNSACLSLKTLIAQAAGPAVTGHARKLLGFYTNLIDHLSTEPGCAASLLQYVNYGSNSELINGFREFVQALLVDNFEVKDDIVQQLIVNFFDKKKQFLSLSASPSVLYQDYYPSSLFKDSKFFPFYQELEHLTTAYKETTDTSISAYIEFKLLQLLFAAWKQFQDEAIIKSDRTTFFSWVHGDIVVKICSLLELGRANDPSDFESSYIASRSKEAYNVWCSKNYKSVMKKQYGPEVNPIYRMLFDAKFCGEWEIIKGIDSLMDKPFPGDIPGGAAKQFLEEVRNEVLKHKDFNKLDLQAYDNVVSYLAGRLMQDAATKKMWLLLQPFIQEGRESLVNLFAIAVSDQAHSSSRAGSEIPGEVLEFYRASGGRSPHQVLLVAPDASDAVIKSSFLGAVKGTAKAATGVAATGEQKSEFHLLMQARRIALDKDLLAFVNKINENPAVYLNSSARAVPKLALAAYSQASKDFMTLPDAEKYEKFKRAYMDEWAKNATSFLFGSFARSTIDFKEYNSFEKVCNYAREKPNSRTATVLKDLGFVFDADKHPRAY